MELYFDDEADARVRAIWRALTDAGVPSLASGAGASHAPHVSLAVFDRGDLEAVAMLVGDPLRAALHLPLVLGALGFFLTEESVAFLGVVPSPGLISLHRAVHGAIADVVQGYWPNYQPGALVPHCTVATGVTDHATVVEVVKRHHLPITATVTSAHIIELPDGHSRFAMR